MIIRRATLKDQKDIQKLNLMLFQKEFREFDKTFNLKWTMGKGGSAYYRSHITGKNACAFIAEDSDKTIGYLVGSIQERNPCRTIKKEAEVQDMFVLEEYRGQKIGTRLFDVFRKWAKKKGADTLCVTASAPNERGIEFYKRLGFHDYDYTLEMNL